MSLAQALQVESATLIGRHIAGGAVGASRPHPMGGRARTELNGTEAMKVIGCDERLQIQ